MRLDQPRRLLRRVQPEWRIEPAVADEEARERVGAVAGDGNAPGLEVFESPWQIEDRLGAGADDRDAGRRQLLQVGRDVHRRFGAAMDAADAARRHDRNSRHGGAHHGGGHRGATVEPLARREAEIAPADLQDIRSAAREPLNLGAAETNSDASLDNADGCR